MKICKIFIRNLNSLKGEFTIDFESAPLHNCGLFAITGPTGAGKSTVLDALTLALYGRSPRMDKISSTVLQKTGGVLSHGTREATAEVEFICQNQKYLAHWSVAVNRNNNLNDYKYSVSTLPDGIQLNRTRKDTEELIPEITGLSYDQFTRTVLLAQGDFARLLESGSAERYQLLEKITGEKLYRELGKKAFEKNKELNAELHELELKKGNIVILSSEEIEALNLEQGKIRTELQKLDLDLKQLRDQIQLHTDISKIQAELLQLEAESNSLEIRKESLLPLRLKWESWQKVLPLSPDYQKLRSLEIKADEIRNTLVELSLQQDTLTQNQKQSDFKLITDFGVSDTENFREIILSKLQELEKLRIKINQETLRFKEKDTELKFVEKSYKAELDNLKKTESNLKEYADENIKLNIFLEENKKYSIVEKELSRWENELKQIQLLGDEWKLKFKEKKYPVSANPVLSLTEIESSVLSKKTELESSVADYQLKTLDTELTKITEEVSILPELIGLSLNISESRLKLISFQSQSEILEGEKNILVPEIEAIEKDIKTLSLNLNNIQAKQKELIQLQSLDEVRNTLQKDMPCPVCGSVHHPGIHTYIETLYQEASAEQEVLKKLDFKRSRLAEINGRIKLILKELKSIQADSDKLKPQFILTEEKFNKIQSEYFPDFSADQTEFMQSYLSEKQSRMTELNQIRLRLNSVQELNLQFDEISFLKGICEKWHLFNKKLKTELESFFPAANTLDSTQMLKKISEVLTVFLQTKSRVQELNIIIKGEEGKQTELKRTLEIIKEKGIELRKVVSDFTQNLTDLKTQQSLFPDIPDAAQASLDTSSVWTQYDEQKRLYEVRISDLNTDQAKLFELLQAADLIFQGKIREKEIVSREVFESLFISEAEGNSIATQLNEFDLIFVLNQNTIADRKKRLAEIKPEDWVSVNIEEIKIILENRNAERDVFLQRSGSITTQLSEDLARRREQQGLLNTIGRFKEKMEPWIFLDELIGDAKGQRFNDFAQQLTLKIMLMQANANLELMSDRYTLSMALSHEAEDSLYVTDAYLGNVRRAADKTLSGGEKFLVSLALALGLSDLSAGKIQISNLFIDEGFGSLDPDSLDKVIGILENLQQKRGRTIGIISHVNELKERIQVQVQIEPLNNGASNLRVVLI